MKLAKLKVLTLLMFLTFGLYADGIIIPDPVPHPPIPGPHYLNINYHKVRIDIEDNVAQVVVDQEFENPYSFRIEGTYIFPLPEDATISSFSLVMDGKEIKGEVLERDKARQIYQELLRKSMDPALLEYYDKNMFRARIFPLNPHKTSEVKLSYEHIVPLSGDFYKFVYPLKIDALTLEPMGEIEIEVHVKTQNPLKTIFSPTHEVEVERIDEYNAVVKFKADGYRPTADFELFYSASPKEFDIRLLSHKLPNKDGFFMLTVSPGYLPKGLKPISKDIVFVLDVSGSMSGDKIEQAKEGLLYILNHLDSKDNFNIIAFSNDVELLFEHLVPASKLNIQTAKKFVEDLEANGGTNIIDALDEAIEQLPMRSSRPKYIVFLTDGQPTIKETNDERIIEHIQRKLGDERMFIFGVGYDVNTYLLDKLAEISLGTVDYVQPGADLEVVLSGFYNKIAYPALVEPQLRIKGVRVYAVYPEHMPDLFYGSQVVIVGRYKHPGGEATIVVRGKRNDSSLVFTKSVELPRIQRGYDFIPRIWARRRVAELLAEIKLHGERKELVDEIVDLGTTYGIVTPYTSFLVTEQVEELAYEGMSRPQGGKFGLPTLGVPPPAAAPAPTQKVGRQAFAYSQRVSKLKQQVTAMEEPQYEVAMKVKVVGDKTFELRNSIWVDLDYDSTACKKTVEIKFGSTKYFKLLNEKPKLAKYLSVGKYVIVVYKGVCYKITE